jgi:phosphoadenosine phosphosulfate reductase
MLVMSDFAESSSGAGYTAVDIAALNAKYRPLSFAQRIEQLYRDFDPAKVMVTSSFAATSAYFLHIISRIRPQQAIFFIDTGFHFPETLSYKDYLVELYGLVVKDVRPEDWKHDFTVQEQTYKSDPDFCCSVNKVEPLEEVKKDYQVWVSSLMRWQTSHRSGLDIFEERGGIVKFYPMVDVGKEERDAYIREHQLPFHPLVAKGYSSIGCSHCTVPGDDRAGRWVDTPKKECGLHL